MSSEQHSLSLLIADDHPVVLQGLERLLGLRPNTKIVASVTDGKSAREQIRLLEPHIGLIDINMPELNGLDVLDYVEREGLPTRVILLTASTGDAQLKRAVINGAWGIVFKDCAADELLQCIDTVAAGTRWLPQDIIGPAIQREEEREKLLSKIHQLLTGREQEIAHLIAEGLSNKEIARQVGISEGTVKIHLHNVYSKLEVANRTSLATLVHRSFAES